MTRSYSIVVIISVLYLGALGYYVWTELPSAAAPVSLPVPGPLVPRELGADPKFLKRLLPAGVPVTPGVVSGRANPFATDTFRTRIPMLFEATSTSR